MVIPESVLNSPLEVSVSRTMDEDAPDEKVFYIGSDNCDGYTSEEHSSPYNGTATEFSEESASNIVLKQLHALRVTQMKQGVDLSGLTRTQWGLSNLKFCHHIILKKSSVVDIPLIFQVTICAGCCPSEEHASLFLGVYGDQESALLVNDVHEILNGARISYTIVPSRPFSTFQIFLETVLMKFPFITCQVAATSSLFYEEKTRCFSTT